MRYLSSTIIALILSCTVVGAPMKAGESATGIGSVKVDSSMPMTDGIYNIYGQKVGADYKGIIIINGHKTLN